MGHQISSLSSIPFRVKCQATVTTQRSCHGRERTRSSLIPCKLVSKSEEVILGSPHLCAGCTPTHLFCALHILALCRHHVDAVMQALSGLHVQLLFQLAGRQVCLQLCCLVFSIHKQLCTRYWLCCEAAPVSIVSWNITSMLQGVVFDCSIASTGVELYPSSAGSLCLQPDAACLVCNMAQCQASSRFDVGVLLLLTAQQCSQKQWMLRTLLMHAKLCFTADMGWK